MAGESSKRKIVIDGKEYESLGSADRAFKKSRNTVNYRLSKELSPEQAVGLESPPKFASAKAAMNGKQGQIILYMIKSGALFAIREQKLKQLTLF